MDNKETETVEEFNFSSRKKWQKALNAAPAGGWIKERKLGGVKKSKYVPIQFQQALADHMFNEFDVSATDYKPVLNEITCNVTISVLPSYPNAEHRIISGVASKAIQCRSGSTAETFPKGKILNALEYNLPAVRAAAISNALTTFGNVFGRNIGRQVSANYSLGEKEEKKKKPKKSKK